MLHSVQNQRIIANWSILLYSHIGWRRKSFSKTFGISSFLLLKAHKHRGSRPEMFCEKCVLKNLSKFTGKNLCRSLLFSKVAGYVCNKIKKRLCHFWEIFKNTYFREHLWTAASGNTWFHTFLFYALCLWMTFISHISFINMGFISHVYEWRL